MPKRQSQRNERSGLTLVELLVVIGIMLVLASVAIPTVRFLTRDREIREATRSVNTFIESARNDALATGRAGFMLERSDNDYNKSLKLFKVKFPPPYSGDTFGALAHTRRVNQVSNYAYLPLSVNTLFETGAIQAGDEIQFDNKGAWYLIYFINGSQASPVPDFFDGTTPCYEVQFQLNNYPGLPHGAFTSYQIRRQPVKNNSSWVDLPKGTFVDLNQSGFAVRDVTKDDLSKGHLLGGGDEFASEPTGHPPKAFPVAVTFRSDGEIEKVYFQYYDSADNLQIYAGPPPASVFFLVAFDNLQSETQPVNSLLQLSNAWVSISRGHGKVTTATLNVANGAPTPAAARKLSRAFARSGVSEGGS